MAICVVVNGPSSVGKSTLVGGLQELAAIPLLRFGSDELYRMVPARWTTGGASDGRHSEAGFSYREAISDDISALGKYIHNGPDAVRMLYAMNAGVTAMVQSGCDLIVDGQAYEPEVNAELHQKLRDTAKTGLIECSIVELTADAETLVARQERHAHPAELALPQSRRGWVCPDPDLHIDTRGKSADDVLRQAWDFLIDHHPRLSST